MSVSPTRGPFVGSDAWWIAGRQNIDAAFLSVTIIPIDIGANGPYVADRPPALSMLLAETLLTVVAYSVLPFVHGAFTYTHIVTT